ncbi:MAG: tyrosine-type recombinase/integrase [Methylocella sp.]
MLKIFQRGAFWYVRGTIRGRTVYASTKERDKASARRFREALETRLARLDGDERPAASFAQAAEIYVRTRTDMSLHWRLDIERLCAAIGELPLGEIRQHVLVDAANQLLPHGQAATKNSHVIAPAAAILHYAAENELCPHIKVRRLKEKKSTRRPVRKDDAVKLLDAATGDLRLLLIFLFHQGWRIGDTLRLTWRDIDLDAKIVTYRISKTDDCLDVPLADVVADAFESRPNRVGRVFPWRDLKSVYRALQPLCEAAGVAFTPHRARHSFATWQAAEGASLKEIMEAGVWRDYRSVLRYAQVDIPRVRATMNRIKVCKPRAGGS